jgi:hypothetical protein
MTGGVAFSILVGFRNVFIANAARIAGNLELRLVEQLALRKGCAWLE